MSVLLDQSTLETDEGLLDDIIIQMEYIEDSFEKAIARYDYPFADGADLEDMGQKAHVIKFRCWFWDDADNQTYQDHTLLLKSLETKELLDFVHPKYGLLKGKIESIVIQHNDDIRIASIELTFIEQMRKSLKITAAQGVMSSVEEAYQTGQNQQQSLLEQFMKEILPAGDVAAVSAILDEGQGLLTQFQGYSEKTRLFVAGIETRLSAAEAVVNQIVSPVNSIQATLTYAATLPGRVIGMFSTTIEKYSGLHTALRQSPALFISRLDQEYDNLEATFQAITDADRSSSAANTGALTMQHLQIACAQRMALEAAAIYAADVEAANGRNDDAVQIMTMNELESTLAIVRARLETAVEVAREMDSLKAMAAALLTQVNSVRLEREKMVKVTLDNHMPLHLVCLKYGLSYADAERLMKVNHISKPNFTNGEVLVYAS
jgi:prophage DNA circulation protein